MGNLLSIPVSQLHKHVWSEADKLVETHTSFVSFRGDKESWIRSKYVEKKFIQKLPETGRNPPLRRSSARRNRAGTQDRTAPRPPIKPKPNRATLPRLTGTHRYGGGGSGA